MWKSIADFMQTAFTLSQEQNRNRAEIKVLQDQVIQLTLKAQALQNQIAMNDERHQGAIALLKKDFEIEILKLRQELNLRRAERGRALPPAAAESDND